MLERSKQLEAEGFRAQVKVTRETTLLFCDVAGRREPIQRKNGNFAAGKKAFSRDELLAAIEARPEDFSPNALLRPVMQDTLLPTAAYIGGPAEVAYLAQSNVVYGEILGRMPAILPRASFTVVEPPLAHLLAKYELDMQDFFLGRQHLRAKMEAKFLPPGLADQFEKDGSASLRALLDRATKHSLKSSILDAAGSGGVGAGKNAVPVRQIEGQSLACREHAQRRPGPARKVTSRFDLSEPRFAGAHPVRASRFWPNAACEFLDELAQLRSHAVSGLGGKFACARGSTTCSF